MNTEMWYSTVEGTAAAKALSDKLIEGSAFFQMTPMPDDFYQFGVKVDCKALLEPSA